MDLNDDLLNYELGDLDDHNYKSADEIGEDELLLSDEELELNVPKKEKSPIIKENDKEKEYVAKYHTETPKNKDELENKCEDAVTSSAFVQTEKSGDLVDKAAGTLQTDSDVSTTEQTVSQPALTKSSDDILLSQLEQQSKNDEVSSTNKEVEALGIGAPSKKILPDLECKNDEPASIENAMDDSKIDSVDCVDSQEDAEERVERTNIKQIVERGNQNEASQPERPYTWLPGQKRDQSGIPMRGGNFPGVRPPLRYPHSGNYPPFSQHPNENINPQSAHSSYIPYSDNLNGSRLPLNFSAENQMPVRMDFRPALNLRFRSQNPSDYNMYRGPRYNFGNHMNGSHFNAFGQQPPMRPIYAPDGSLVPPHNFGGHIRPRMQIPRPPNIQPRGNIHYMNAGGIHVPSQHIAPPQTQNPENMSIGNQQQIVGKPVTSTSIPRKVLINPNFKGGVEAATSQLMKDTQFMQTISSHVSHLHSDEELLRQQEEFINKNRKHIEKRRFERSPDRNRSRERSYSPQRRDRRERRASSRGRTRRGDSKDLDWRIGSKRRRSDSFERRGEKSKTDVEDDEETRAYRIEIEKQKAMREKILRDKELRRRKAAEGKLKEDDKPAEEQATKLKPIIVTESKIISLKKKSNIPSPEQPTSSQMQYQQQQQPAVQRLIPTAKILPETKRKVNELGFRDSNIDIAGISSKTTLAVIKPVLKTIKPAEILDNDLLEEERLLADTPSPPSSPPPPPPITTTTATTNTHRTSATSNATEKSNVNLNTAFKTSNRRVVLKSKDIDSSEMKRGIFDRLERKISVNEAVKRKIQRIVIKNAE